MITMTGGLIGGISGMSNAVAGFRAATAAGFTISESGAAALISAINHVLDGVLEALGDAQRLIQEPPLGTTPAAEVYKPFLATIATDPVQGFIPAVTRLQDDLEQLLAEVEQATTAYRTTDQHAGRGVEIAGDPITSV
jgi:hypothetical protein